MNNLKWLMVGAVTAIILAGCIKQTVTLGGGGQCLDDVNSPLFGQINCPEVKGNPID